MKQAKKQMIKALDDFFQHYFTVEELDRAIKINPQEQYGDLSLETFRLEKRLEYPKKELARDLLKMIPSFGEEFMEIQEADGFLNLYLNKEALVQRTLSEIINTGENYGRNNLGKNQMVVFDYSAPNIGKPLHVGHIRSTILGDSLVKLMRFSGYQTHGINYLGDVGLHLGKILYAYKTEGSLLRLQAAPETELLELYVSFCKKEKENPSLSELAKREVQRIEDGDADTLAILAIIREYSLKSFERVYDLLDVIMDETIGQSNFSEKGRAIVFQAEKEGIAKRTADNALIIPLKQYNLPDKVVLRSDGTAIYSTQDIGAAVARYEQHHFDQMLYVVGEAQATYFQQLFKALHLMGYNWADKCAHVGFGLIHLKEGKMATREGIIVHLEELLQKAIGKAKGIIEKKNPSLVNKDEVARKVGIGAVKYQILAVDKIKDIRFSWESALDFSGRSAPNIQYSYVRANSILKKAGVSETKSQFEAKPDFEAKQLLGKEEYALIRKMAFFPLAVEEAVKMLKPNTLANYTYELASTFNTMYAFMNILENQDKRNSRLALIKTYKTVLENALGLLGIGTPQEM